MKLAVMLSAGDLPTEQCISERDVLARQDLVTVSKTPTLHNFQTR